MAGNNNNNVKIPGDLEILLPWLNIVRRAKQMGAAKGPGLVKFAVLIDESGNPLDIFTMPAVITFEPKARSVDALIDLIGSMLE